MNGNQDIVVLKANKGGVAAILDKEDYRKKMLDHLCNTRSYKKLNNNPLKRISIMISLAIKSSNIVITPRIYGLPKIHKDGVPLRPIVNTIGGPIYLLAKYLPLTLKPLVCLRESFFKDYSSFVNTLRDMKFDLGDNLVILDVVSLYTDIPIKEAIEVINRLTDPDTTKVVEICLLLFPTSKGNSMNRLVVWPWTLPPHCS